MYMKKTIGIIYLLLAANAASASLQDIDLSKAQCTGDLKRIAEFFPVNLTLKPNPEMTNFLLKTRDGYVKNPITHVYADDSKGFVGAEAELVGWGIALGERTPEEKLLDPDNPATHVIASLTTLKYLGLVYAVNGGYYDENTRTFTAGGLAFQCLFPR
jgi:hypothetical protein